MKRKQSNSQSIPMHQWRSGYRSKISAEVAQSELDRISSNQPLTAEAVVDSARPDEAPLHPVYTWDDELAAEKYRRHEARTMIRAVVTIESPDVPEHRTNVLVRIADAVKPAYLNAINVASVPSLFADAVSRLSKDVASATASLRDLERIAQSQSEEPERIARISLASQALSAASAAISALH